MVLSLWPLFLSHSVGGNTVSNAYWLSRCLYTLPKNTIVRACLYLAYISRGNGQYTTDCLASSTLSTSFQKLSIRTWFVQFDSDPFADDTVDAALVLDSPAVDL